MSSLLQSQLSLPVLDAESSYDLYLDKTYWAGYTLGSIGYGFHLLLVILCVQSLWKKRRSQPKVAYSLLVYVLFLFSLGTIGNAAEAKLFELAFVEKKYFAGGPSEWLEEEGTLFRVDILGYVAYIIATWMQDGLMLYRFLIVFGFNWWFSIGPFLVYVLSIVMSCLLLVELTHTGQALFSTSNVDFAFAFWASSIATTTLLTFLIIARLLFLRRAMRQAFGVHHQSPYLSVSAILAESALLYSVYALVFLVLAATNDPGQNTMFPLLGQIQMIAPELIILRVAQGRSFSNTSYQSTAKAVAVNAICDGRTEGVKFGKVLDITRDLENNRCSMSTKEYNVDHSAETDEG